VQVPGPAFLLLLIINYKHMDNDNNTSQGSPRYVDETGEADKNLRPNLEDTEQRGTNQPPLSQEEAGEGQTSENDEEKDEDEDGKNGEETSV
jgi:hypothetical protein